MIVLTISGFVFASTYTPELYDINWVVVKNKVNSGKYSLTYLEERNDILSPKIVNKESDYKTERAYRYKEMTLDMLWNVKNAKEGYLIYFDTEENSERLYLSSLSKNKGLYTDKTPFYWNISYVSSIEKYLIDDKNNYYICFMKNSDTWSLSEGYSLDESSYKNSSNLITIYEIAKS